ncbi:MAG: efflux RND transporter periplasmic adaptor subunit [Acetobacteraceae bacterium]|nr:efflux RND transporter periplasmic adaptor subunit [Acetobacteraceae bacterium]
MKTIARFLVTLVIIAISCAAAYELWNYYMLSPWTRDARVQADVVTVAPDVSGFVSDIRVKDNQFVHKGDVLFVLDQERYKAALAAAEAAVAARKADMQMRQQEADRRTKLTSLSISDEAKQDALYTANSAAAAHMQAVADRMTARINLERTVIRAPVNGFITNLTLDIGQYISVGTRAMALIDSDSYRVEGYFEETKIPALKPGDAANIILMSGGPALRGHVDSISRGITDRDNPNGPELLANANPTFEWVRLAQRIPVRIHIDEVPEGVLISSGMTCTVVIPERPYNWAVPALLRQAQSVILNAARSYRGQGPRSNASLTSRGLERATRPGPAS